MKSALLSRVLILLAATSLIAVGCRKIKQNESSTVVTVSPEDQTDKPVAGYGGQASIYITPNHDGLNIDSCLVYIKFDSPVVPQNGKYDDSIWASPNENGLPVASFKKLLPGNYYLYADGWDLVRSQKVRGGLYYIVEEGNERTAHSFVLPVQDYE